MWREGQTNPSISYISYRDICKKTTAKSTREWVIELGQCWQMLVLSVHVFNQDQRPKTSTLDSLFLLHVRMDPLKSNMADKPITIGQHCFCCQPDIVLLPLSQCFKIQNFKQLWFISVPTKFIAWPNPHNQHMITFPSITSPMMFSKTMKDGKKSVSTLGQPRPPGVVQQLAKEAHSPCLHCQTNHILCCAVSLSPCLSCIVKVHRTQRLMFFHPAPLFLPCVIVTFQLIWTSLLCF